ncbi:unnamed protein product [Brassicogethes aeneus]|uniref:Glutaredoxin 3 n=1 Tax=Brassicogethes aeneus TaxID=1431903 RepID=A0A9P0FJH0_BRAAE|nr:unnamed protein product [Brassicogethes aeneus]
MPLILTDNKSFEEIIKNSSLSAIHFSADWAEQCAQINELFDTLSQNKNFSNVKFAVCPAEELSEISLEHKIEAVPTVLLFRSSKEIARINGVDVGKITDTIEKNLTGGGDNKVLPLEDRLKALINKSKVMLFMKGDRNTPRCGFSRQTIEILKSTGAEYETFDILTDEEVRQGLKTYSDWPTYPQLYVNGDLIGGLDIIKEMVQSGDLTSTLNS